MTFRDIRIFDDELLLMPVARLYRDLYIAPIYARIDYPRSNYRCG